VPVAAFYELTGEPSAGKTTLATLISKEFERVAWVVASLEDSPTVWSALQYQPAKAISVRRVDVAFHALRTLQESNMFDLLVLDSLAGLGPEHSGAHTIAADVRRNWFKPSMPILIINQDRLPAPVGGVFWASTVERRRLRLVRRRPALYSQLVGDRKNRWLVWWSPGQPEFRRLEDDDWLWLPRSLRKEGVYGSGPDCQRGRGRQPWIL